jgi:hypothetical protein
MKHKSVRLALVSVVAVLSVFGLSQSPAGAAGHVQSSRVTGGWCC